MEIERLKKIRQFEEEEEKKKLVVKEGRKVIVD